MTIQVFTIGGYEEVGKNMTAVRIDGEIVILDLGWHLEKVLSEFGEYDPRTISTKNMIEIGAFPDDSIIHEYKDEVKAIVLSHAHLDHVAAVPKMAPFYKKALVIGTPFTIEVVKKLIKDEAIPFKNKLIILNANSSMKISKNIEIEFIYVTHSTPQSVMIAVHTKYGIILFTGDFKFDNFPVIGQKTNMARLKAVAKKGVLLLIVESTRVDEESKTFSESVFNAMFKDVLLSDNKDNLIVATTFSSHISRIKTIVEYGTAMGRTVVIMGHSMKNYISAAETVGIVKISDKVRICHNKAEINKTLKAIAKDRSKYLILCTGHQGEPDSVLDRISKKEFDFTFQKDDQIIFCCCVIPAPVNIAQRMELEKRLKYFQVRLFKDIHVHGHASMQDIHDLIKMISPKYIIPNHGNISKIASSVELARKFGYSLGKNIFMMQDGSMVELKTGD